MLHARCFDMLCIDGLIQFHNNPIRGMLILTPLYTLGNWDLERLDYPKELVKVEMKSKSKSFDS